jgi:hypothetical protein
MVETKDLIFDSTEPRALTVADPREEASEAEVMPNRFPIIPMRPRTIPGIVAPIEPTPLLPLEAEPIVAPCILPPLPKLAITADNLLAWEISFSKVLIRPLKTLSVCFVVF